MTGAGRRNGTAIRIALGLLGIAGWAFYLAAFRIEPSQDWMVFHTAARAALRGDFALLFDGQRLTQVINRDFENVLSHPLPLHPWLYPPHFLLLLLPFGLLPFWTAQVWFLALSFAALAVATALVAPEVERRRLLILSVALCPAAAITVCLGQNAFLTAALLVGGFGLKDRRPFLGGALLGLLSVKPQLGIMVPVALVALRQWRVLGAATGSAALLMGASAAVFGLEPWRAWVELMSGGSDLYRAWIVAGRLNGDSAYSCAVLLGATPAVADVVQAAATALAAGAVYRAFRSPLAPDLRLAVLLAATILGAPHTIGYDSVMLAFAATLQLARGFDKGARPGETAVAALVWLSPLINPPSLFRLGLVTPLLILLLIAYAVMSSRAAPPVTHVARMERTPNPAR